MPIDYRIDHERKLVIARGRGVFTGSDMVSYQQEVWSQQEVAGYNELVDMSEVEEIVASMPAGPSMQRLASMAATQDLPDGTAKFAVVAPASLAFALAREYQTYRDLEPRSKKQVGVFRTFEEALSFLGLDKL